MHFNGQKRPEMYDLKNSQIKLLEKSTPYKFEVNNRFNKIKLLKVSEKFRDVLMIV